MEFGSSYWAWSRATGSSWLLYSAKQWLAIVILIGIAETVLGLWILSGIKPRWCAIVQWLAIVTMNALELRFARELLLAPGLMVLANTLFLLFVWYWALNSPQKQEI